MLALLQIGQLWIRRKLPWSNSRQAWEERLGVLLLFLGLAVASWSAERLLLWQQAALWLGFFLMIGLLLRRGWLKLLGPLFLYELLRAGRRSRYILLRLYVYFVLIIFLYMLVIWWADDRHIVLLPATAAAQFFHGFFLFLVGAHLLLVILVTPGYTAGAIAEEKDRRTLEALLATDLRSREIVLSKLVVRLANLTLMLLTGLPIWALLQTLGGIDPDLVLAGFLATGVTMTGLASLSLVNSVYARKSRDAILYTYLEMAAYGLLSGLSQLVMFTPFAARMFTWSGHVLLVSDLIDGFSAGNPFVLFSKVIQTLSSGGLLARSLPGLLRNYMGFHLLVTLLCAGWAVGRLRAVFLRQASRPTQPSSGRRQRRRRPVGDWPMVWKEAFAEPGIRFRWFGWLLLLVVVIASFVPALLIVLFNLHSPRIRVEGVTIWALVVGAIVACFLLVGVAVRAATSISGERDRLTWDSLLTSPLDSSAILFGKWLGSLLGVRWGWLWLGTIWGLGSILGGMHGLALPLLAVAWTVYAGLLAMIGLWFSLVCPTTSRAMVWTLFTILALAASFLVLPMYSSFALHMPSSSLLWLEWLNRAEMSLTPPIVLAQLLPFGWERELPGFAAKEGWEILGALGGLCLWALAVAMLWVVMVRRFRRLTNRCPAGLPRSGEGLDLSNGSSGRC